MNKINVQSPTLIKPEKSTPNVTMWISNLDMLMHGYHLPFVFFYRKPHNETNFFDTALLKASLRRILVHYYPVAGRLKMREGRLWIECNDEGVLFIEAEFDGLLNDCLGDLVPTQELGLIPKVDYSKGISNVPLLLFQVTRFKCGGVCLGAAIQHNVADGYSMIQAMNSWCEISRGLEITIPPFLDRTILRARDPPNPKFDHIEYQNPNFSKIKTALNTSEITFRMFRITRDQLNNLKNTCSRASKGITYSTYEILAAHAWTCASKARLLPRDQETKLYIAIDGRSRLKPAPPLGYFGSVLYMATPIARAGELTLKVAVEKVHEAIKRMDDEYMRSALDYLELSSDLKGLSRGEHTYKCPNFGVTDLARLTSHGVDFGWGSPVRSGLGGVPCEGKSFVMASPENDGSLLYAVSLPKEHMEVFEKLLLRAGPRL